MSFQLNSVALLIAIGVATPVFADEADKTIRAAFERSFPGVRIDAISPSRVTGLYEVNIGASTAYATQDGKYVFMGDLLDMTSNTNLTEAKRTASRKQLIDAVGEKNMIVMAPKQVKHTVTVFTDIDCGYCRKLHQDVPTLNKEGIKVRYLAFPRSGPGTESFRKYENVWCAKDRVKAVTSAKAGDTIEAKTCANPIQGQYDLGQRVGVEGTPAIVLESGEMLPGYLPPAKLLEAITMSESRQATRANTTAR